MKQAVVVDCVRTPIGRSHRNLGVFRETRADALAAALIRALLARTGIDPAEVEDLVLGVSGQQRQQAFNVARMVGLVAGLRVETAATSINRLCGSGLQAINQAAHAIQAGAEDVQIVGGLEHMLHVGIESPDDVNPDVFEVTDKNALNMGWTAEYLARAAGVSRQEQDEFALRSHRLANAAQEAGEFRREIVPVAGHDRKGQPITIDADQCIRPDTSLEQLSQLQPAFLPAEGTVTAGNSAPLNDGAAAMLIMSDEKARQLGLQPLARVVATAVAGVDPRMMGLGPVPAARKALRRAGLEMHHMDLVEINEAFAVQALVCQRQLEVPDERLNVRGGAIALGHPLGASGARVATTLLHALRDRDGQFGLATLCIGVGQGIATVFERLRS